MRYSSQHSESKKASHWPLWVQVTLLLLVVIVAGGVSGGILIHRQVESYLNQSLTEQTNKTFSILSAVSIDAMIAEDVPLLETIVNQATEEDPNIVSLVMLDISGRELVKWDRRESVSRSSLMKFERDITLGSDVFGRMKVTLNSEPMLRKIREHVRSVASLFIGILSLVAVILIIGIHRVVIRPVQAINQRLVGLRGGDMEARLSISAARELMRLAGSVNELAAAWKLKEKREKQLHSAQQELEQSNKKLADHSKNLEEQVQMRTGELATAVREAEDARRGAEEANLAKSSFLATMSHELRTPLNAIIGYSEMLIEEAGEMEPEECISDLEKIIGAGKHLLGLINDILDLSKIEAGKMELSLEEFELGGTLSSLQDLIAPKVKENNNQLKLVLPENLGTVVADSTRLRQCVINLMANSAKFTENGTITLEASRSEKNGEEWISIGVSDTGIGMTSDQMAKLFRPFAQADSSTTRKFGGTGLGLTITRHFCQMMGGDITIKSESGVGSTFTIKIPARVEEFVSTTAPRHQFPIGAAVESRPPEGAETTLLVIDDDPSVHDLIRRSVAKDGYWVVSAYRGADGIRLAKEINPDMITLDIMMPEMDGWQVIDQLRSDGGLAQVPVIILSVIDDSQKGLEVGATDVLMKPISKESLLRVLGRHRQVAKAIA